MFITLHRENWNKIGHLNTISMSKEFLKMNKGILLIVSIWKVFQDNLFFNQMTLCKLYNSMSFIQQKITEIWKNSTRHIEV